jgi:transaldolase
VKHTIGFTKGRHMSVTKSTVRAKGETEAPDTYLNWLARETRTAWWHDSADPVELRAGLDRGAVGVTTNPVLAATALERNRERWAAEIDEVLARKLPPPEKAEALMRIAVVSTAQTLLPLFVASQGRRGHVCAQVSPLLVGDREGMLAMARRLSGWAANICVKVPATSAGLDVIEQCAAEGISTNATVSFTLAQLLAVGERTQAGMRRAREKGIQPAKGFATMMIGRLDDYLREVAQDNRAAATETDVRQAGLAVVKRAHTMYRERGYDCAVLVAAMRGTYHLTQLAGGDLVFSVHPSIQQKVLAEELPREEGIEKPLTASAIDHLSRMAEFRRAYEPDGVSPPEFVAYGATQRTLGQFVETGWNPILALK